MKARTLVALLALAVLLLAALFFWSEAEQPRSAELLGTNEPSLVGTEELTQPKSERAASAVDSTAEPSRGELRTPVAMLESERPVKVYLRGRASLSDGSTIGIMELAAIDPAAELSATVLVQGVRHPEQLFGQVRTNTQGEFQFEFDRESPPSSFRIEQLNRPTLGQNDQVYEFDPDAYIEHVVPGGWLSVEILDPSGVPVYEFVNVTVSFTNPDANATDAPETQSARPGSGRSVHFLYSKPVRAEVRAVRPRDGAFGLLEGLYLDPEAPYQLYSLPLTPLTETGELELEVIDSRGLPVVDFAVTVNARDGSYGPRTFSSEDLGSPKIIGGLPLGMIDVQLTKRLRWPPSLYSELGVPTRVAGVVREAPVKVQFRVSLETRLAIELTRSSEEQPELGVRSRHLGQADEPWASTFIFDRFFADGSSRFGSLTGDGLYVGEVVREGQIELEVYDFMTEEVVWTGSTRVQSGALTPLRLKL